jgi:hypothetical protein
MASKDYLVLEISSPTQRDTFQVEMLSLVSSKEGEHQILPMHEEWQDFQKSQTIVITIHDSKQTSKLIHISDALTKVIHVDNERSKVLIACNYYSFDESDIITKLNQTSELKQKTAFDLAKAELIPSLNPTDQELRDIEQDIRKEFEESLK